MFRDSPFPSQEFLPGKCFGEQTPHWSVVGGYRSPGSLCFFTSLVSSGIVRCSWSQAVWQGCASWLLHHWFLGLTVFLCLDLYSDFSSAPLQHTLSTHVLYSPFPDQTTLEGSCCCVFCFGDVSCMSGSPLSPLVPSSSCSSKSSAGAFS